MPLLSQFVSACAVALVLNFVTVSLFAQSNKTQDMVRDYCSGCHADGANEGSFSFDELQAIEDPHEKNEGWYRVLKQLQARAMPPQDEAQPSPEEREHLENWIQYEQFGINPQQLDPGHVVIRRLNQVEYRNTIRDLLGVDFDTSSNFPADDTGHGFDTIGEVLSMSPLLLEKYVNAADEIISQTVPTTSAVVRRERIAGNLFERRSAETSFSPNPDWLTGEDQNSLVLSYYHPSEHVVDFSIEDEGTYDVVFEVLANETYVDNQFDENACRFTLKLDGQVLQVRDLSRQNRKLFEFQFEKELESGEHQAVVSVQPLTDLEQIRQLRLQIRALELVGPKEADFLTKPEGYANFFPRDVPRDVGKRRQYAEELLRDFAGKAYRRPVRATTLERLVDLAQSIDEAGGSFESGVAKAMTAVLASPQFLFREEVPLAEDASRFPLIDEYSLASRLSYFLWSSMPDDELLSLAAEGRLRSNLDQQIDRMLQDERGRALSENFVGQWLRARAVETIQINAPAVLEREPQNLDPEYDLRRVRFFELFRKGERRNEKEELEYEREKEKFLRSFGEAGSFALTDSLRQSMRYETEMLFHHILVNGRSLLELVDSDYTFLNEELWTHYHITGIPPVLGEQMRLVKLPVESRRGGVLTQGTTLVVTSNPDRTSPVKRGLFILENLLGTPPAAPPPNVPSLEDVQASGERPLTLRESLAIHRENALCSSCHDKMDPLGLALENFNALGRYREVDLGQPVDAQGVLSTGHRFATIQELKQILATERRDEIYRCITEKMMTYALGRAVDYSDSHSVDELVVELEATAGDASVLLHGVIASDAFQRMRR